jgi:hypothetical protein
MSQTNHLLRRSGTWYYRRRVPLNVIPVIRKPIIQFSLKTTDPKGAKKLRAAEDLR